MSIKSRCCKLLLLASSLTLVSFTSIAAEKPASLVTVETVREDAIAPTVWLAGNVVNRLDARISAEQSGRLLWLLDVGEEVTEDQVIARLDDRDLQLQLAERKVQLKRQAANIEYFKKQQKRLSALLNNNSTSRVELDRVERDLKLAEQDSAALDVQIKQIQLALDKAQIKAPFAGKIKSRLAQQGEYVTAGSQLLQLVDPQNLDIRVAAPLSLAPYLNRNSQVLVKWQDNLVSLPIKNWSPAGDTATRTFEVLIDASRLTLLSGTSVSVSLPSDTLVQSTMVPRDALLLRDKQSFVVIVDQELKTRRVSVEIGRGQDDWIAVEGQLESGEQVVIRGGERLKDGQKVRLQNPIATDPPTIAAH